jgi:outer membrane biosynthesis protein TonB
MRTRWLILGFFLGIAGGAASAGAENGGLTGLDAELNGTGRVGAVTPGTKSQIEAPDAGATPEARPAKPLASTRSAESLGEAAGVVARAPAETAEEYHRTEARVANCRIEVARRRQVPPAKVAAGTVTVRFTVEPSGRVRDAEAISASDTDLEVSACAKRVLSEWVFAKHAGKPITVERTYQLAAP